MVESRVSTRGVSDFIATRTKSTLRTVVEFHGGVHAKAISGFVCIEPSSKAKAKCVCALRQLAKLVVDSQALDVMSDAMHGGNALQGSAAQRYNKPCNFTRSEHLSSNKLKILGRCL
eukprot:608007-Amphidinium_carterae.1